MSDRVEEVGGQVLLVSHHPELVDFFAPDRIIQFRRSQNGPVRHRPLPIDTETGLTPAGVGRFVIQEEGDITLKYVAARLGAGNLELVPVSFYQDQGPATRSTRAAIQ